ncbi:E3 ubiquitin-protein ligase MARCHF7 isoform X2 [Coregonus clupeaformis]|uniref:E3 ubiquitin-protein ligase MARCHF7 isoform X2 n=1 Tax=Coregonus clupeaformis TaxID=59861 RepID=UPI001E1C5430|nr:E3 ubiquitin-protein ligase MARCHF7 isoform X2 [Coregonus clupeaformis]
METKSRVRGVFVHIMYSWERRAAENLTNAEHMREVRKRIDLKYQDHLRRREQERADAEVRREIHRVRPPSSTPQTNRFKACTYERPWAQGAPDTKKSSSSVKSTRSETRNSQNKGSVYRLPAISSGTQRSVTQSRTTELATTSKTRRRATALLASHCKEQSPPCHKHRSVDIKNRACKLSTCATKSSTLKLTQSQDTLRGKSKMGAPSFDHADSSNIQVKRPLDNCSHPQPLTSSGRSYTDLSHLPSLQYHRSPSPDDPEPHPYLQLISDPFQDFSESSSITEEYVRSEDTYRAELCSGSLADTSSSSVPESLPTQCPSSSGTLDSSSLSLSDSFTGPLSSHFRTLGVLSSESESDGEDDGHSWQDADRESYYIPVRWTASQSSSNYVICPSPSVCTVRSPRGLQSQLSMESTNTPEESSSRASYTGGGYNPMPSLMQVGRLSISPLSISPSVTQRASRGTLTTPEQLYEHLPELDHLSSLSPRRANPIWLGSERWLGLEASPPRTSYTLRHSQLVSRIQQEEPEEVRGASSSDGSTEDTPSSSEASHPGTSGLMDHLTMALHDIRREVAHIHMTNAQQGSGAMAAQEGQSAPATNPETLRKIKERLLEESCDEEEGDQCRICQCGAGSPTNPLLTPCLCSGSLQYIHHDCLKRWIQTKIQSGTTLSAVKTCELCKGSLTLDLDDFDMEEFYQRHAQTQVEQTSPELYMLLILQQRFSELLQAAQSRSNVVSRVWRLPLLPHTLRVRASRGSQRGNHMPEIPDPPT